MDMLVMNEDFESTKLPVALQALQKDLEVLLFLIDCKKNVNVLQDLSNPENGATTEEKKSLDERKLEHSQYRPDVEPRAPATVSLRRPFRRHANDQT